MRGTWMVFALCAAATCACGASKREPPRTAVPAPTAAPAPAEESRTRSVVNIAPDIRKACGISDADAHFAFDSADVRTTDHQTLDKLVHCFTSGPLSDRQMRLVGHADPRGSEEYNLALGGSRADSVRSFLVGRGLPGGRATTTSRGEMEARGSDEPSWAHDRRVDILLAN